MTELLLRMLTGINTFTNALGDMLQVRLREYRDGFPSAYCRRRSGFFALIIFKYTSNQKAIGRVRDDIKANLLAVKLFRDNFSVAFRSQARVMAAAVKLLVYSLVPMLVIILPVCLVLAQMGAWYQAPPCAAGGRAGHGTSKNEPSLRHPAAGYTRSPPRCPPADRAGSHLQQG